MRPPSAKIIQHAEGMGAPNSDLVRRRAREIAMIDGRAEFNEEDWREAKRELHGGHDLNDTNGDMEMAAMVSEHDMVIGSVGHHSQNMMPDDNDNVLEELIAEGMDEAVHEQMLAARQEQAAESEEEEPQA
ncbi:MAG: hypothetical protein QOE70_5872 [Chthoniobacter sp.]|nr:hypothetical protein [Chthoniobacter sp.]